MIWKKRLALIFAGVLSLNVPSLACDPSSAEECTTKTSNLRKEIQTALEKGKGNEGEELFHFDSHKDFHNISCILKEGDVFKAYTLVAAGRLRRKDDGSYIIRADEKKCWDLVKANYETLAYSTKLSKPRNLTNDMFGGNERFVFSMDPVPSYFIMSESESMITDFVKELNNKTEAE